MLHTQLTADTAEQFRRFTCTLAHHPDDVRAAQRLRWEVFAAEGGAMLDASLPGHDIDRFDLHCAHLIVRDHLHNRVVGTYRLLMAAGARQAGGYYAQGEFEMTSVLARRARILELGRSCVHPDYRSGAVMAMLWSGVAQFVSHDPHETLIGCASVSIRDGGITSAAVHDTARLAHYSDESERVRPLIPMPSIRSDGQTPAASVLPPLIKGYLRAGAVVCGPPAYDAAFQTADFFMMLPLHQLSARHARHFGASTSAAA